VEYSETSRESCERMIFSHLLCVAPQGQTGVKRMTF
jgi:hypothetical protein